MRRASTGRVRVATEYAVSAFAQDLALRFTMFGAPSTFIEQALQMALDELAHATDAAAVAAKAGARPEHRYSIPTCSSTNASSIPRSTSRSRSCPSLCLGEVLALRIVHHERAGAREPVVVAALDRIVRDEPRHAALGWQTLDWLLASPHAANRARVRRTSTAGMGRAAARATTPARRLSLISSPHRRRSGVGHRARRRGAHHLRNDGRTGLDPSPCATRAGLGAHPPLRTDSKPESAARSTASSCQ